MQTAINLSLNSLKKLPHPLSKIALTFLILSSSLALTVYPFLHLDSLSPSNASVLSVLVCVFAFLCVLLRLHECQCLTDRWFVDAERSPGPKEYQPD